MNASLVAVSPSTVMQLNERAAALPATLRSALPGSAASVATKPSIVAMSGRIMPAPFAMPVTTASPVDSRTLREKALGTVSVVMIASAAASQSLESSSAFGSAATILSAGSGSMITPVEKGRICFGSQPRWLASASQTSRARLSPSAPVPALALPVLTTSARTSFLTCSFARITGAAQNRFCVNTPATCEPGARRITSRSLRPGFLMPAIAMPRPTPLTACREPASGAERLTAMRLGQLAVAVLVFLARAAGAGIVATDLLRVPHGRLRLLRFRRLAAFGLGLGRAAVLRLHVLHVRPVVGLGHVVLGADLDRGQRLHHLELDRLDHRTEELERLALVFLLRILLRIAAQVYSLA